MDELYKNSQMYNALVEFDEYLYNQKTKPFELNVVGGFALLLENIRTNCDDYTDIDYIGIDLDLEIRSKMDEIGIRYGLGRGWINNDVLMSGNTLEDMEFSTGKLNFRKKFELRVITINSLDIIDILRMKVIAIDTSFVAMTDGSFERTKDFNDIRIIMEKRSINMNDLKKETFDYVLDKRIYKLINYHIQTKKFDMFIDDKYKRIFEMKL